MTVQQLLSYGEQGCQVRHWPAHAQSCLDISGSVGGRADCVISQTSCNNVQSPTSCSVVCSFGEKVSHYASLVLAEKPLEAHQQYKRRRSSIAAGQLPPDLELGPQVCSHPPIGSLHTAARCSTFT